ncbi:hypothetical protein [Rhizobium sp. TRM95796]|uniref:hypothetical protein n=1 Tax=Rhizobium sp. TRM95796 TaxID=2979862 RepID=UPI0021E82EEF|nr:hypothetical protein [Rhizobium sp. TRM95796]MCV3765540.1 hypothetical protein [Rhizobium sp. TRM95796]
MKWLERANDLDCLRMIWAVDSIQSGNDEAAKPFLKYPKEAVTSDMSDKFAIYKWELETIITSLLTTPKDKPQAGRYHFTNLQDFNSFSFLVNILRSIEEGEYNLTASADKVLEEMYKVGQRQFSWQRGYNSEQLFRYAFVYGQGECGHFFQEQNGLSVSSFIFMSLVLFGVQAQAPFKEEIDVSSLDVAQEDMEKTLNILSSDITDIRKRAKKLNLDAMKALKGPLKTAYMPSVLRQKPIVRIDRPHRKPLYISPLTPLIMHRATAGLYYDIAKGPKRLLSEANSRFEDYVRVLTKGFNPRLETLQGAAYGTKANRIDPPDCLVKDGDAIVAIIECKATKLTFAAQFSENPIEAERAKFDQLVKGIYQVWRFFSHARRGIYAEHSVSPTAYGIVLTMDNWMQMADKLRRIAADRARELAAQDIDITAADMKTIIFVSVQELADTCIVTETDEFLQVLSHACHPRFEGYSLPQIARECGIQLTEKKFPLKMNHLLPWWEIIKN